jgi:hypothetical protein
MWSSREGDKKMLVENNHDEDRRRQLANNVDEAKRRKILTSVCEGKFTDDRLGYIVSVPLSYPESFLKKIHDDGFPKFEWAGTTTENGRRATLFQFTKN